MQGGRGDVRSSVCVYACVCVCKCVWGGGGGNNRLCMNAGYYAHIHALYLHSIM